MALTRQALVLEVTQHLSMLEDETGGFGKGLMVVPIHSQIPDSVLVMQPGGPHFIVSVREARIAVVEPAAPS